MWGIRPNLGWVTSEAVAIFSALLVGFWAAVGIVVGQQVAQEIPADKALSGTMVTSLVREPLWWAGTLAAVADTCFKPWRWLTDPCCWFSPVGVVAAIRLAVKREAMSPTP